MAGAWRVSTSWAGISSTFAPDLPKLVRLSSKSARESWLATKLSTSGHCPRCNDGKGAAPRESSALAAGAGAGDFS
eukprot:CAMPEP_0115311748 /NCGR_PEP_ID=MMETSP0270-20121206/75511_1 /TAXON_ID=71861 /ORGANISM="Scrippsiella trochoidea, Strain CCMP3099" /LENGTH=75 /DNA_ID=CAMNT_0002730621 /DNA_START=677 /DNA_END=904 /DNA_ORIENTATION=+